MRARTTLLVLALTICAACPETKKATDPATAPQPWVARVGDRTLTIKEVEAQLQSQPDFIRARYSTPERKREFVESLVRNELLLGEARRLKLDETPEFRSTVERLLVQQLTAEMGKGSEPTEAELRAYFDEHQDQFSRPERVQVSFVQFGARPAQAAASVAEVEKEVLRLRKLPESQRRAAFSTLVLSRSTHEGSRTTDGDLGLRTREELATQLGSGFSSAAWSLRASGDVVAVESPGGAGIVFLTARQPGETRSFESERTRIAARLVAERTSRKLSEQLDDLRSRARVDLNSSAIESLDAKIPTGPLVP